MNHVHTLSPASIWILSRFQELEQNLDRHLQDYELTHSIDGLYKFLWDDFADWYVEYLKTDNTQLAFAKELFKQYIVLLSPYAPFETEALWTEFFGEKDSLALAVYDANWSKQVWNNLPNPDSYKDFELVINFIQNVRSLRGLFAIDPVTAVKIYTTDKVLLTYIDFIKLVARAEVISEDKPNYYNVKNLDYTYSLDIFEYIKDREAEKKRTQKLIGDIEKQITQLNAQLSNQKFLEKAETEVIAEKQEQLKLREVELKQQEEKLEIL